MINEEVSKVFIEPGKYGFGPNGNAELGVPPNTILTYIIAIKHFEKVGDKECRGDLYIHSKLCAYYRVQNSSRTFQRPLSEIL
jgi:hypothetical protein